MPVNRMQEFVINTLKSSLAESVVVKMITCGVGSDENFVKWRHLRFSWATYFTKLKCHWNSTVCGTKRELTSLIKTLDRGENTFMEYGSTKHFV